MDNTKIYDTRLTDLNTKSVLAFLSKKHATTAPRKINTDSIDTDVGQEPNAKLLPSYSFIITDYLIGQHVEYNVTLREQFTILRKTITKEYKFKTRFSMLEALDEKLGGLGLPAKKWFGNKNPAFVEKRRGELEDYLNKAARCRKIPFYKFIKQIQDTHYNASLNEAFSIE